MLKVLVGSQNPVKIESVREAFSKYFNSLDVIGLPIESNVSKQPIGEEAFRGAKNRVLGLNKINMEKKLGADFLVGIEGGIGKTFSKWFCFGIICISDKKGRLGFGSSPYFEIPEKIAEETLSKGLEIGDITDKITGKANTKQKGGLIGHLTNGIMDRKGLYVPGLIAALVPFINQDLFFLE